MGCAPTLFHFEQDRLFLNLGDGRFQDVTEECGIIVPDGKGLSCVAADFMGTGRIDLFVANDTTPNLYFSNQVQRPGDPLSFVEKGVELGVAMNAAGQSQASMGLTVGDANGDQLPDFYVGTFLSRLEHALSPERCEYVLGRNAYFRTPRTDLSDAHVRRSVCGCRSGRMARHHAGQRPRRPILRLHRPRSDAPPVLPESRGRLLCGAYQRVPRTVLPAAVFGASCRRGRL